MRLPFLQILSACLFLSFGFKEKDGMPKEVALELKNLPNEIDFNIHVKPILSDKCFACHGPDKAKQKVEFCLILPLGTFLICLKSQINLPLYVEILL